MRTLGDFNSRLESQTGMNGVDECRGCCLNGMLAFISILQGKYATVLFCTGMSD